MRDAPHNLLSAVFRWQRLYGTIAGAEVDIFQRASGSAAGSQVMSQELNYRRGRLVLPQDIADWPPETVAQWIVNLPLAERAKAFRALPLNVAAAGFLKMEPRGRVGTLSGLNAANIRYLCSIARDDLLLETLDQAGPDVRGAMFAQLPAWRRSAMEEALAESDRAREAARVDGAGPLAPWWSRLFGRVAGKTSAVG
ncbi:MAG: hypothetical protein JJU06_05640 [Ectothiorhodospiraceae bacterium]|nr:hypothetical protein [Ectothiorhodospiraceae bacterium]